MDERDMRMDAAPLRARFPALRQTGIDEVARRQLAIHGPATA
jgi:hypothetical protein